MTDDKGTVSLTRILAFPCAHVYGAWTKPEMLARWLAPGQWQVVHSNADARIGGAFSIELRDPSGSTARFYGTYLELVANKAVVLAWRYDGPAEVLRGESLVEVCLRSIDSATTELRLTHTRLAHDADRAYRTGWPSCVEKLAGALADDQRSRSPTMYTGAQRAAQERYVARTLADRVEQKTVRGHLSDDDRTFIGKRDMFFLSTVDELGMPTVSYKGGKPGFVFIEDDALCFPSYDGNGMYLSIGNISVNPKVGLLFVDFETPRRLRVQGHAVIDDGPAKAAIPGAICIVRVTPIRVFANCARYVHAMQPVTPSRYVPAADGSTPMPSWKRIDEVVDSLSESEAVEAHRLGIMSARDYAKLVAQGDS